MKWRDIPKIDAHIHIIPDEVHAANPDSDDEFSFAEVSSYQKIMDQFNIRKAIIMPFNDPWLMSMDATVDAAHHNLLNILDQMDFTEEEMHMIGHTNAELFLKFIADPPSPDFPAEAAE